VAATTGDRRPWEEKFREEGKFFREGDTVNRPTEAIRSQTTSPYAARSGSQVPFSREKRGSVGFCR
jgi:hypothetical protein